MRFSLKFIKQYVDVDVSPKELASLLTMAGMEVERIEKLKGDFAFDIEVTTNRYDWLSMAGIAREAAAVLGKDISIQYPKQDKNLPQGARKIIIENLDDCPYYIGKTIENVKIKPAAGKFSELITHCNISSVNNAVDITNYCMLKWGNPLHAFDNDKIEGNIYVRRAKRGESFLGIDEKQRELNPENLVIADDKKVIALAGIMGAKNTEVDQTTKNIFLEAAVFSPLAVRRSRRAVGLDTESSYRFERMVSPDSLEYASSEAAKLIEQEGAGKLTACCVGGKKPKTKQQKIKINLDHLNSYLGSSFSKVTLKKVLKSLGFETKDILGNEVMVKPALDRFDVEREVDVYEEFSRVYGYDKIPAQLPFLQGCSQQDADVKQRIDLWKLKSSLSGFISLLQFKEIITFSLEEDQELILESQKIPIELINPLRKQENCLRTSLLPGVVKSIKHNLNRGQGGLRFFEIANIYLKSKNGFSETPTVALAISGERGDFFYLKRAVGEILNYLNIEDPEFKQASYKSFTNALAVVADKKEIGFLGKLDEKEKNRLSLKEDLFFAQLDLIELYMQAKRKRYKPFSPYPAIWRDISLFLKKEINFYEIEKIIQKEGKHLVDFQIIDIYKGKDVPENTTAFTLRIFYQSSEKTLSSQEVDFFHNSIREKLANQSGVVVR